MRIVRDDYFLQQLLEILRNIASDKPGAALHFEQQLNKRIRNLIDFPWQGRPSHYFEDKAYRDMIHDGYTIIYKVEQDQILILEIFKWQDR